MDHDAAFDAVFKALADPTRRALLDGLNRRNGQTLRELCAELDMTRQAVTKHLAVLEAAGLVHTVRRGREKFHHLNAAPINDIADRWIGRYNLGRVRALADLKRALEEPAMSDTAFVYVTYIQTTPEKLWRALTEPEFITQYFGGGGPTSEWAPGSPVIWRMDGQTGAHDWGQRVLAAEPNRLLSYTWHNYEPEMLQYFPDWAGRLDEMREQPISKVTFEIEPAGEGVVKLTVTHDGFAPGSEMLASINQGWPGILSSLKSMLELGHALTV
ncbi:ArsR family transcriptional regulator [Actinorhabdospora filicis]|uniref:ArsR family transcriptional regulator n=1 Tax=Actinorhabdospora filicis TaxID=1785913 RepID=A0A9W6SIB5_9ACTN|nr:metalloregulator ArsR/SmtB family transcription factor [Actinorhabdospora filicis]GLZ76051.1 ArsR family transcriptional regulator [Actinorhabdospora filicis]